MLATFRPPPKLTVSEWADRYRMLSPESSSEPGRWDTSRAEYQRGMMDAISDPAVEEVVLVLSSQTGKSECVLNSVGYYIDQDPSPMLVVLPILDLAQSWSKDRLAPMIRDTPALTGKVADTKSRDSSNSIMKKNFAGGQLTLAGANSPASLSSRPVRFLLCDEVDRFPASAGTEGDPVNLARKRTRTFWNRKIVLASTPTDKETSRILAEWEISDQRRYWVPCQHCGTFQLLEWKNVRWNPGEHHHAKYWCPHCNEPWSEPDRLAAIRYGEWRAEKPENAGVAGFHINELYSPWSTPADMAADFMDSKDDPDKLKTFINTALAEGWEESAERADATSVESRLEDWGETAPTAVKIVTCGVDVQDDRLEVEKVGWAEGEESWSLDHKIFYGDPSAPALWDELDQYLLTATPRADGRALPVHATSIDSGGHYTQTVYAFCKERARRKVWAIKGASGAGRLVWPKRATKVQKGTANVFILGVDAAKDITYARLKNAKAGPGYMHFPVGRDPVYFEQLTAEVVKVRKTKGFRTRVYELPPGKRNEALDLRVYAYAALLSLNVRWNRDHTVTPAKPAPVAPAADGGEKPREPFLRPRRREVDERRSPRRGSWLNR